MENNNEKNLKNLNTEKLAKRSENLTLMNTNINKKLNNLIFENYGNIIRSNDLIYSFKNASNNVMINLEKMINNLNGIELELNKFNNLIDVDITYLKSIEIKVKDHKEKMFIKRIPSKLLEILNKNDYLKYFSSFEFSNSFLKNSNQKISKEILSQIEIDFNIALEKFNESIKLNNNNSEYYFEIASIFKRLKIKNVFFSVKLITEMRIFFSSKIDLIFSKSMKLIIEKTSEKLNTKFKKDCTENFISHLNRFYKIFFDFFVMFDQNKNKNEYYSLISFVRDVIDEFLKKYKSHLCYIEEINDKFSAIKFSGNIFDVFEKLSLKENSINLLQKQTLLLENFFENMFNSFIEKELNVFIKKFSLYNKKSLEISEFMNKLSIYPNFISINQLAIEMCKIEQISKVNVINILKGKIFKFIFQLVKHICYSISYYDKFKKLNKKIYLNVSGGFIEKDYKYFKPTEIFRRTQMLSIIKNKIMPEIRKSVEKEFSTILSFFKLEKSFSIVIKNGTYLLLYIYTEIESKKLLKILKDNIYDQAEKFKKRVECFETSVVDCALDLKSNIKSFHNEIETFLQKFYKMRVDVYSDLKRTEFYKKNKQALNTKVSKDLKVQRNLPSAVFNVWKMTLFRFVNEINSDDVSINIFRQIQINISVIHEMIPFYIHENDVCQIDSLLINCLEKFYRKCGAKDSYLSNNKMKIIFKKYHCFV